MIEDKVLVWRFKAGCYRSLCRIYEKYKDDCLRLAALLLNDVSEAEDIVHDVFVIFAQSAERLRLNSNLKSYLLTCVANRARNINRAKRRRPVLGLDQAESLVSREKRPDQWLLCGEELETFSRAMSRLPYEQREVVILRLRAGMKFRQIAQLQDLSVNTVKGRYRYGLIKLRSILNGKVPK